MEMQIGGQMDEKVDVWMDGWMVRLQTVSVGTDVIDADMQMVEQPKKQSISEGRYNCT